MTSTNEVILLVTHLVPYPPARGVELRILKLLKWLTGEGYKVILAVPCDAIHPQILSELRKVTFAVYWTKPALRTRIGQRFPLLRKLVWERAKPWFRTELNESEHTSLNGGDSSAIDHSSHKRALCPDSLIALVAKLAKEYRPSAVIAEYIFLTPAFQSLSPETMKIVDTIDVFSRKSAQVLSYGIEDPQACTANEEREYLLSADVIVAIQSQEAALLKQLAPEREVLLVGMDFETVDKTSIESKDQHTIAIIASDNVMNVHGLRGFLSDCWPQIKVACPEASLHIVGNVGNHFQLEDSSIRHTEWIDDLKEVYAEATLIVNPAIAGTGLKVKSVQALAHGKPLVAWPSGVEGLPYEGEPPYLECHSWEDFALNIVRLLDSKDARSALSNRALSYAQTAFDATQVYAPLKALLQSRRSHSPLGG